MKEFEHAVLDSGNYVWQPWMTGYDWGPEFSTLPWVPHSSPVSIG